MRGTIFLTGATGFVGGELLRRLLRQDPRQVVCLVRADDLPGAQQRGEDAFRKLGLPLSLLARTRWLPGDVQRPRLGMDRDTFRALAHEIDEIYHCAASTTFDLPLEEAQAINVRGVKRVFNLALAARKLGPALRRLHHVSTAYVAGRTRRQADADFLPDDDPQNFRNTYERTKARAERFLRARMDRVPITIYRPSIVVGDSRTGYTSNWNVVYYPMRLMASGLLPYAPRGGRALLDCVPVDYVVDAMLALGHLPRSLGQTYNITAGDDALTVMDVIAHTYLGLGRQSGQPHPPGTRALRPFSWWCLRQLHRLRGGSRALKTMEAFDVYVSYCRVDTLLDCSRERAELEALGVRWTPSSQFFLRVTDYALRARFGKRSRLAPAPRPVSTRLAEALQSASGAIAEALASGTGSLGSVGA